MGAGTNLELDLHRKGREFERNNLKAETTTERTGSRFNLVLGRLFDVRRTVDGWESGTWRVGIQTEIGHCRGLVLVRIRTRSIPEDI
jgi:hypothetical protein